MTLETNATPGAPTQPAAERPGGGASTPTAAQAGPGKAGAGKAGAPRAGATGRADEATTTSVASRLGVRLGGVRMPAQGGLRKAFRRRFRMPGTADPRVRLRRLALVAVWATLLGFGGLGEGIRVLIGLFTTAPSWYLPTICGLGIFGLACTVGAFASVHRRRTPWILLVVATATLITAWLV